MTRLHPAAPAARTLRALVAISAALVLAIVASGCAGGAPPEPTPDPFSGLVDRSDQAFRQGLEAYGQGQYRDALTSFEQARLLSPTVDPRVLQMIERSQAALAPTPTAVPATPTPVPVAPTPVPVAMSTQTPDTELGNRYFGRVTLAMVPGRDTDAPPATQFFFQDQIGLHVDGLKQHLRLPFTVRVFDVDSARLVAEVQSDDTPGGQSASAGVSPSGTSTRAVDPFSPAQLRAGVPTRAAISGATANATPAAKDFHLVRFWDTFVWYHQGGDQPGRYRVELFANGILTHTFDYSVVSVPVASPTAVAAQLEPTSEPSPASEIPTPAPSPVPDAAQPRTGVVAPVAVAVPTVAPTPIPEPTPTIVPTPANAYTTLVGGAVAGLDVDSARGRFYLADTTGVIWSADAPSGQERPTLNTPFTIGSRSPVDLAVDQSTGYLYLSTRLCVPAAPGCVLVVDGNTGKILKSIALSGAPGDLRIDSDLGLLYVSVPERQAVVELDIRGGSQVRTIGDLPQITSLALDPIRHTLYAAHLAGQVSVIDVPSGQVTARVPLTGAGLSSVATARGLAYAVNTATHEMAVLEPVSQAVDRYVLNEEPAAVAASEDNGAVYVLSSRANVILQIDPTSGFQLGSVILASRSGSSAMRANGSQSLRPRMVIDAADQTVFASLPEAGALAAVVDAQFPISSHGAIPFMHVPEQASANAIPGVLRPAANAGPSQPAPSFLAQTPDPQTPPPADSAEEGV